jgi:hypothetical protein
MRLVAIMVDPIHCGQSADRGVEIWAGSKCLGRATTSTDAYQLALAMLMGPQKVGGALIRDERIRMHIARCALTYILEGE